jgi:hypothetical protein
VEPPELALNFPLIGTDSSAETACLRFSIRQTS